MMCRILVVVLVAWVPVVAHADGPCDREAAAARKAGIDPSLDGPREPAAIERINEGNAHHKEGIRRSSVVAIRDQAQAEFQAAINAYVAGAMISSAPSLLYNLAQTYRAAGDYPSAIEQYRLFLDRAKPRRALRLLVECHIASMTAEIDRAASTAPPREPATIDAPDDETPKEPTHREPAPSPPAAMVLAPRVVDHPASTAPHWYSDGLGWGITSGGVAVAGVGAFLLLDARSLRIEANAEGSEPIRVALRDRADARQTWGTITSAVGAAIVVVGVIKLARTPDATARPALTVRWSPTGVALAGWF